MTAPARAVLPAPEELARALGEDLAWLAEQLGAAVVSATPVSPLRGLTRPRTAFHVVLDDGRAVKLRRNKSAERAAELTQLLERVAALGLPQAILRREGTVVMEWLDAAPFDPRPDDLAAYAAAGELLGALHATADFDGASLPVAREVGDELEGMEAQLAALVESGHLADETAAALRETVRRRLRAPVLHGVAHGDFAAENLLVDAQGRLRLVDNESLQVGPLDLDLARTAARWPMPRPAWRAFLAAYAERSGRRLEALDDDALRPWQIRTLVLSAWYRMAYGLPGVEEPLAELRVLGGSARAGRGAVPAAHALRSNASTLRGGRT